MPDAAVPHPSVGEKHLKMLSRAPVQKWPSKAPVASRTNTAAATNISPALPSPVTPAPVPSAGRRTKPYVHRSCLRCAKRMAEFPYNCCTKATRTHNCTECRRKGKTCSEVPKRFRPALKGLSATRRAFVKADERAEVEGLSVASSARRRGDAAAMKEQLDSRQVSFTRRVESLELMVMLYYKKEREPVPDLNEESDEDSEVSVQEISSGEEEQDDDGFDEEADSVALE
ncbi:MAG: hypothetical protein M1840_006635 [Geoglossum simile]|nr:MAG: hypothetical protein M1840_006635 [Geoglossum simile]